MDLVAGKKTKSQLEVVLHAEHADVNWTRPYRNITVSYSSYQTLQKSGEKLQFISSRVPLPGAFGREAHAYLTHIVNRYDSLADRTVFVQDRLPSVCGWFRLVH